MNENEKSFQHNKSSNVENYDRNGYAEFRDAPTKIPQSGSYNPKNPIHFSNHLLPPPNSHRQAYFSQIQNNSYSFNGAYNNRFYSIIALALAFFIQPIKNVAMSNILLSTIFDSYNLKNANIISVIIIALIVILLFIIPIILASIGIRRGYYPSLAKAAIVYSVVEIVVTIFQMLFFIFLISFSGKIYY